MADDFTQHHRRTYDEQPSFTEKGQAGLSPDPHLDCGRCHNETFTLRYGCYELVATCAKCGYSAVVYDG